MEIEKHLHRESEMCFETSEIYKAIKEKTMETPTKTLAAFDDSEEDVNSRNTKAETYFHFIAQTFERDSDAPYILPVVYQLANAGLDVNSVDRDGNTALHVAAKLAGRRKLIRALVMVGCDPNARNTDKLTAVQLARSVPDNVKIIEKTTPSLWEAVSRRDKASVEAALAKWGKVTQERNGETLLERAEKIGYDAVTSLLKASRPESEFVHYCLAGERQKMRPLLKQHVNVNVTSPTFIDTKTGEYVSLPLIGECALLGLESVVRKLVRKSADLYVLVDSEPVYLYIFKNIQPQKQFYQLIDSIGSKIDFRERTLETSAVLDAMYDRKVPMDVLRTLTTSGLDLFAVDKHGHFLRDRILIANIDKSPKALERELAFVDNIVVDMASFGLKELLRRLINRNYDHIEVKNQDGLSSMQAFEKATSGPEMTEFFTEAAETLKRHRNVCRVIEIGHLAQFQNLLTLKVAMVTDKRGRTLFHKTVMYERRHIIRLLVKVCPEQAHTADVCGRTPLHWACLLPDEEGEIEDILVGLRCKMDVQDENGLTPADFKAYGAAKKAAMLEAERALDPGLDTYLYCKYAAFKEAIRAGDLHMMEDIRTGMYPDVPLDDLQKRMYQTETPVLDILQMALDARRDVIAKYLLISGMPWDVKVKDGKEEVTLLEAAKRKEMKAVEAYINHQLEQKEEQEMMLNKLKKKGKRK